MYKDEYLFLPEAKIVDKLLSVFNIQSQQQLAPNEVISILGLLNLLNLVGIAQENIGLNNNLLNGLVNNSDSIDEQQVQTILQQLNNGNSQNNLINYLTGVLNNKSNSGLESLLGMIGENNGRNNSLDPTVMLKLMNLVNQIKENKMNRKEEQKESNNPVKSQPYKTEDEHN